MQSNCESSNIKMKNTEDTKYFHGRCSDCNNYIEELKFIGCGFYCPFCIKNICTSSDELFDCPSCKTRHNLPKEVRTLKSSIYLKTHEKHRKRYF